LNTQQATVKNYILLPFILLITYTVAFSQPGEIVFSRMTKENGLASSRVNAIIKDHQGYYWISSSNGLQRFDGKRMVNFQHDPNDTSSIPDNLVMQLKEDNKHRLWINCHFNPYIFDPFYRTFKKIPVDYPEKNCLISRLFSRTVKVFSG
jgi:ligand-binding sensor domain-containing protein